MALRMAFIGFRHAHVLTLYKHAAAHPGVVIAGACEEDADARRAAAEKGVQFTHESYADLLRETDCGAIACGDYFGIRGQRIIQALETGKHVIADKPICTRIKELDIIESLSRGHGPQIGCMLDLGDLAPFVTLRRLVQEGRIGEVCVVNFLGQHPLNYGKRPSWYYEPEKHGGTLNDIAVHALDYIPSMAGQPLVEITATRVWSARLRQHPQFQEAAVILFRLANGAAVMGDVSYLQPDSHGYAIPSYWRISVTGAKGIAETALNASGVSLYVDGEPPSEVLLDPPRIGGYLDDFLATIEGRIPPGGRDTKRVLESARHALLAQQAADTGKWPLAVG